MESNANPEFERALLFAATAHVKVNHARKGTDFPYVVHPIRVAQILDQYGYGDDVVVAGFLHDTIEDAGLTESELATKFNARVAELVVAVTEPDKSLPWRARKENALEHLQSQSDADALALKAADQLDNLRAIHECLDRIGPEATWALFNAAPDRLEWYYGSVAEILTAKSPGSELFRKLTPELAAVFPSRAS